ncbi:hypothetical protein ACFSKI_21310 [Pseudogracilibacillus auburnensis]|uniref:Uncharacterized protein n=1 Tax=Pseudogracilibacillus auburnensis TaxID=1494959 RepID=A0A2V3WD36_9BACI|nr:hypothetical protein [Pseudogracilibacillus auburnensis]PXW86699.1 hypothetical protein DFR56_107221 [Pseudogracilibacillus auburnensis]
MNFTKEVEYIFNYEIDGQTLTKSEYQFVDDIDNRRYRWVNPDEGYPQPLQYGGTGAEFQQIEAELIGESLVYQDNREEIRVVVYDLKDVDVVMIANVNKITMQGNIFYEFIINNVTNYHKKLGGVF